MAILEHKQGARIPVTTRRLKTLHPPPLSRLRWFLFLNPLDTGFLLAAQLNIPIPLQLDEQGLNGTRCMFNSGSGRSR
jgi:hypothetical protein